MTDFSLNLGLTHTSGHNPPVGVAFQFLLVGRLSIEFNGRYSASKLMTAVAQPGHNPPVSRSQQRSFERRLRSETCRMTYFRTSASAVIGVLRHQRRQCAGQRSKDWKSARTSAWLIRLFLDCAHTCLMTNRRHQTAYLSESSRTRLKRSDVKTPVGSYSAPDTHAVRATIPIGRAYTWSHTNTWSNSHPGGADAGRRSSGPSHATFRHTYGLAINDSIRGYGSKTQAQS